MNERDKFMMQGLKNLGLEKGKPFQPTDYQKELLEEATLVGETMAMANSFSKRNPVKHWADDPESQWQYILFLAEPITQPELRHRNVLRDHQAVRVRAIQPPRRTRYRPIPRRASSSTCARTRRRRSSSIDPGRYIERNPVE